MVNTRGGYGGGGKAHIREANPDWVADPFPKHNKKKKKIKVEQSNER